MAMAIYANGKIRNEVSIGKLRNQLSDRSNDICV
jgi:hypothetical protein